MAEGSVKFYNAVKQFGFINGDDGKSYFFHASAIDKATRLNDGDRVSFTIGQGDRGPRAEKVVKLVAGKAAAPEHAEHKKAEAHETHVKAPAHETHVKVAAHKPVSEEDTEVGLGDEESEENVESEDEDVEI
jgi:CspA family cold shock protein